MYLILLLYAASCGKNGRYLTRVLNWPHLGDPEYSNIMEYA